MIILKEKQMRTNGTREQLEVELSEKLGEKVVILPAGLEVDKDLNGDLKRRVVDLIDCNLNLTEVLKSCMNNKLSIGAMEELETQQLILRDMKQYVLEKGW